MDIKNADTDITKSWNRDMETFVTYNLNDLGHHWIFNRFSAGDSNAKLPESSREVYINIIPIFCVL